MLHSGEQYILLLLLLIVTQNLFSMHTIFKCIQQLIVIFHYLYYFNILYMILNMIILYCLPYMQAFLLGPQIQTQTLACVS